jgi:hypothetical protein
MEKEKGRWQHTAIAGKDTARRMPKQSKLPPPRVLNGILFKIWVTIHCERLRAPTFFLSDLRPRFAILSPCSFPLMGYRLPHAFFL